MDIKALLRERQEAAIKLYQDKKNNYTTYWNTPEDVSDDIHGALFSVENNVWYKQKSLPFSIQLFIAWELLERKMYAAANGMLLWLPAGEFDDE